MRYCTHMQCAVHMWYHVVYHVHALCCMVRDMLSMHALTCCWLLSLSDSNRDSRLRTQQ